MAKMIQIRNVPDDLHRRLKMRAAQLRLSLSDYLLNEARRAADRPTLEELTARLRRRPPVGGASSARIIRRMRDSA